MKKSILFILFLAIMITDAFAAGGELLTLEIISSLSAAYGWPPRGG